MATAMREVRASYAFVERNLNIIKRYWGWEIVFLVWNTAQALAIGFIGAAMGTISGQAVDTNQLVLYLMIGSLVWGYLGIVFEAIGEMIIMERWEGTIEYTFMAPVSRLTHMLGTVIFAVLYGLVRTAVILFIVSRFFSLDLTNADVPSALAVLLVASVGFVGLGIMGSVLPLLFTERGAQMIFVSQACILLVSGVYYPVEVMPAWMQLLSHASPATYALVAVREALLNGKSVFEMGSTLVPLLLLGIISIPIAITIFGWTERYAKRSGRLKRSG